MDQNTSQNQNGNQMENQNEKLQNLKSYLSMIKSMNNQQAEQEFYKLMEQASVDLANQPIDLAFFHYQYADFLIKKMELNVDIFNSAKMPQESLEKPDLQDVNQDDQQQSQNQKEGSVKSQNNVNIDDGGFIEYYDENVEIRDDNQKQKQKQKPLMTQKKFDNNNINNINQNQVSNGNNNQQQQPDDQICYQNLQYALQLYLQQKQNIQKGEQSSKTIEDINKLIMKTRARMGDLHVLCQRYKEAVDEYHEVVELECLFPNFDKNRRLAETHYLIGNAILYENKEDSEERAIDEYINAVNILVNHMKTHLPQEDKSQFELPTKYSVKVSRFAYLPKHADNDYIIELKDVISCLLDKIEDTEAQIGVRKEYQAQKAKAKQLEKEQKFQTKAFEPVPQGKKVVNLGVFGNRKRLPQTENNANGQNVSTESFNNSSLGKIIQKKSAQKQTPQSQNTINEGEKNNQ